MKHPIAGAWSGLLTRHPYAGAAASILAAAVLAVPALNMTLGLPSGSSYDIDTTQRQSHDTVAGSFGDGYNGPLVVVATSPDGSIPTGDLVGLHQDLAGIDGVEAISLGGLNADGSVAVFSLIPASGPTEAETADLVQDVRDRADGFAATWGVDVGVTGFAAMGIDVSDRLADVLPVYLGVVLVLSLLVLLLVFRSIVVPVKATLGFLLSIAATLGATTAVFQWGWLQGLIGMDATSPVLSILPIIITGVLYGLAMDYEMFLVSSMREARLHGRHGRDAVVHGFEQSGRVVVAAAVIMTSVFAGFVSNPEPMITQFGFALAFGILVDAFLVRMTLVPAVMALFGDRAWWLPRWLDRLLPNLDIEGDRLLATLQHRDEHADTAGATAPTPRTPRTHSRPAIHDSSPGSSPR